MLQIHNTLTNLKEEFKASSEEVKIYVCGPTVYSFIHIGNGRPLIFFDTVRKYLEYSGHRVKYVQNFTDIDDKIIDAAKKENLNFQEISNKFIDEYYLDADYLNIKRADFSPRATEHIADMKQMIGGLMEKGYAHKMDDGIYFNVSKYTGYGNLSNQKLGELRSKGCDIDFALWKFESDPSISWDAPWGRGRPGWHIECSAMIHAIFKGGIDIHGGGQDLCFPHHENERAQSVAFSGEPLAKYWVHNGLIRMKDGKMSKSKGNIIKVRDLHNIYSGGVIRLFMLSTHYRKPIDFSMKGLEGASKAMAKIDGFINKTEALRSKIVSGSIDIGDGLLQMEKKFTEEMDKDLNTPGAIAAIFEMINNISPILGEVDQQSLKQLDKSLKSLLKVLGIENTKSKICNSSHVAKNRKLVLDKIIEKSLASGIAMDEKVNFKMATEEVAIEFLIKVREEARLHKKWELADGIRKDLDSIGIKLEDGEDGTSWKIEE